MGYAVPLIHKHYNKICYTCCAQMDKDRMVEIGSAGMYLTFGTDPTGKTYGVVMNWPGTLRFPAEVTISKPVWVFGKKLRRHSVRFKGPDGFWWSGWNYNHNSQCISVRRTKKKVNP